MNEGHQREACRLAGLIEAAEIAGRICAQAAGKLRTNPHDGGSPEWWAWNDAYQACKRAQRAALSRKDQPHDQ